MTTSYPGFIGGDPDLLASPQNELLALARDGQRPGSLTANIQAFFQSAVSNRDLWSQDTWRSVDTIHRHWQQNVLGNNINLAQLQIHLDDLLNGIVAFTGLITESMTREAAWLMLDSGRRLERALGLVSLLRSMLVIRHDELLTAQLLEALLTATDSLAIYIRRYRTAVHLPMVLDLMLCDENHPRSVGFQLAQLTEHISALPREHGTHQLSEEERLILKAYTSIRLVNVDELLHTEENSALYDRLEELLANTSALLQKAAEVVARAYFSHSQATQLISAKYGPEDEL